MADTPDKDSGERYVRTLATDAAALEEGKTPDFTKEEIPQESREEILARLNARAHSAPSLKSKPTPETFEKLREGALPQEEPIFDASERLIKGSSMERPAAPKPVFVAPPPPPPPPPPAPTPALHTYKSDTADKVLETGAATTTLLAAEGDRKSKVPKLRTETKSNRKLFIIGGALIAIGIIATVAGIYVARIPKTVPVATPTPTRIFVDERQEISGTGSTLLAAILASETQALPVGEVRLLYTASSTSEDIFSALTLAAPDLLLRNILPAGSMAGIVNADETNTPFFIISVDSRTDTLAGMLDWEPTMASNLISLYPLYLPPTSATSTSTATSTAATPARNLPVGFVDEEVADHDARALKDGEGDTILIYGYFDLQTLVIARDELAFTTIINRLATSRTEQ